MSIRMSAAAALLLGAALAAPASAPAAASDQAPFDALAKRYSAAVQAKDAAKVMAFYANDGLFVFDVTPPRQYVGWAAYKKDWEGLFAGLPGPIKFSEADLSVTTVGTVAYGHSIQRVDWTAKGKPASIVVRVTDVWRKMGGKWLIVQEHVSVPVDIDTGKADLQSKP